jgi:hypothetical protein
MTMVRQLGIHNANGLGQGANKSTVSKSRLVGRPSEYSDAGHSNFRTVAERRRTQGSGSRSEAERLHVEFAQARHQETPRHRECRCIVSEESMR